jgi:hypothetical protein
MPVTLSDAASITCSNARNKTREDFMFWPATVLRDSRELGSLVFGEGRPMR